MYFTNINNDELKYFKDTLIPFNFSMSLTDILNSSLFYIEDMGNSIYRIYPLFYCKEIISSNSNDKFFDTRCIIAIKDNSKETYYTFKKDNNEDSVIFDYSTKHYLPEHTLDDNLNVNEFNRLVYLIRKNRRHYDSIQIKHNTVITSDYGSYLFDLEDSTITDEGIIITPETIENNCTVLLTNPVFHNSKYYLNLTVRSINNINLCPDDNYSIETSTIRIPLVRNAPVIIPFSEIGLYKIVSFDANVEIIHSEPIFIEESNIQLTSSTNHLDIGETVTLNAVYYNSEGGSSGKTITFKDNGVTIGTATTDNNGLATITYTPDSIGTCNIIADYENTLISNTVNISVTKLTTILTLESDIDSSIPSYPINLSGILEYQGTGLVNKTIKIYDNNTLLDTVVTDNTGEYNTIIYGTSNDLQLKAVFEGDSTYNISYSEIILVKDVSNNYMEMTVTGDSFTSSQKSGVTPLIKTGTLLIDWGDNTVEVFNEPMQHTYESSETHTIKLYGNLQGIGKKYFEECNSIKNVILPDTVISIDTYAFNYCQYLESIILSSNLESIGRGAFQLCDSLTSMIIPNNVTSIERDCFAYSRNLKTIELEWDSLDEIIPYNSYWISGTEKFLYFIIPEGTTSLYTAKGYPSNVLKENISFDGIDLTSTKDILSYKDSDSCTVTAQLQDDSVDVAVSGVSVGFEVRKVSDDSLVETLQSQTTDASGSASVVYYAKGEGDIYIKASCMSLTKTCALQDCRFWDSCSSDTTSKYSVVEGSMSITHSNDYLILSSSSIDWNNMYPTGISLDTSQDFIFEFDCLANTGLGNYIHLGGVFGILENMSSRLSFLGYNNQFLCYDYNAGVEMYKITSASVSRNNWYHYSIKVENGIVTFIVKDTNDTILVNGSFTLPSVYSIIAPCFPVYSMSSTRTVNYVKNIKIKSL